MEPNEAEFEKMTVGTSQLKTAEESIPPELQCPMCKNLLKDAVLIPCCGNSFCDECIRQTLLTDEQFTCPLCHTPNNSPDKLLPNKTLRQAVEGFSRKTREEQRDRSEDPLKSEPSTENMEGITDIVIKSPGMNDIVDHSLNSPEEKATIQHSPHQDETVDVLMTVSTVTAVVTTNADLPIPDTTKLPIPDTTKLPTESIKVNENKSPSDTTTPKEHSKSHSPHGSKSPRKRSRSRSPDKPDYHSHHRSSKRYREDTLPYGYTSKICYKCGGRGHLARDCPYNLPFNPALYTSMGSNFQMMGYPMTMDVNSYMMGAYGHTQETYGTKHPFFCWNATDKRAVFGRTGKITS